MTDTLTEAALDLPIKTVVGKSAFGGVENLDCHQCKTMTGQCPKFTFGKERR